MGLGVGIDCERCDEQCMAAGGQLKEYGDEHNLCPECWMELKKKNWDRDNGYANEDDEEDVSPNP